MDTSSEEILTLFDAENQIRIRVNGCEKAIPRYCLEEGGRGAGSVLAKQVFGTREGLLGRDEITIDDEFVPVFIILLVWLCLVDDYLLDFLTEENASVLHALASYFGLEELEETIKSEIEWWEEERRTLEEQRAVVMQEIVERERERVAMTKEQEECERQRLARDRANKRMKKVLDFFFVLFHICIFAGACVVWKNLHLYSPHPPYIT